MWMQCLNEHLMKPKICFCIDSLKIGGAERLLVDLINNWSSRWDIYLCLLKSQNDFREIMDWEKIRQNHVITATSRIEIIYKAYKFCRANKIQVVNTHLEHSNKCFGLGARLAGAQVFTTVHSIGIYKDASFLKHFSTEWFYKIIPNKVIAISPTVRDYLLDFGLNSHQILHIDNGVDILWIRKQFDLMKKKEGLAIVFCGRLEPVKGLDILLEALVLLDNSYRDWTLDLIGEGSQRSCLEQWARDHGISDRIKFHGVQKDPLKIVCDKSLFCMPSRREGLPIALLEAMALGLPAIVTDVGYLSVLVKEGYNGFVVKPESVSHLAEKIMEFAGLKIEQREAFSFRSQEIAQQYDIGNCVGKYQETFERALSEN